MSEPADGGLNGAQDDGTYADMSSELASYLLLTLRQRLQIFDNVLFFLRRKAEPEARFVVVHDLSQCRESSIMIEAASPVSPESRQRRSTIAVGWGAVGLEGIGANFRRGVQFVSRLGEKRRHVAGRTVCFSLEDCFAARGSLSIERIGRWRWSRDRELIEVKCCQLRTDTVGLTARIAGAASGGDRILALVL